MGNSVSFFSRMVHVIGVAGRDDEPWVAELGAAEVLPRAADLGALAPVDGVLDAAAVGPERATPPLRDGGTVVFVRTSEPSTSERHRFEHVTVQAAPATLRTMARLLGEVVLPDGRSLNQELVRAGYAWWFRRYSRDSTLARLEQEAREWRRGLWADAAPIPPWEYRIKGRTGRGLDSSAVTGEGVGVLRRG